VRTFIAVDIIPNSKLHDLYHDLSANLKGIDIKYTNITHLHVTLAFLGEISNDDIKKIESGLSLIKSEPLELDLCGLGVFKSIRNPQVLWIGINKNELLKKLWEYINKVIESQGFRPDERGFSPHLTIGRIKKISTDHNLGSFLKKYENITFGKIYINNFVFYQSVLTSQGPIYKVIKEFILTM
jgi:RNA 2',3'-cyclic 3'-phosphodiesterase